MDKDTVERLLIKHFGAPRPSLTLDAESSKGSRTYYFTPENEEEIKRIRDVLGKGFEGGRVPRLTLDLPNKNGKKYPLCAALREEGGYWKAEFSRIKSVSFHSTYGKRAAATLAPSDRRAASLSSGGCGRYFLKKNEEGFSEPFLIPDDDAYRFYGFWDAGFDGESRGVPDHINRALCTEPRFRAFAADFFLEGAKTYPILRAVAKTIADTGYFLPRIKFSELVKYERAESLIKSFSDAFPSRVKAVNTSDINAGYLTAYLAPRVDARDLHILMKLTAADVPRLVRYYDLYDGPDVIKIVWNYYYEKYADLSAATGAQIYAGEQTERNESFSLSLPLKTLREKYFAAFGRKEN
ncbi:MAG: hypothetical protein IJS65_06650 [Clostridia bacterium]|nr:hypothetical protein [Clostridia bacterium]